MKNLLALFLLSLLALLVCTCDPENDNPGLVYPLAVGNTWEYSGQANLFFFKDSSETPVYEDTTMYTSSISITITGREPIQENLRPYAFYSVETDSLDTYTGTHYYNNTGEGLLMHAYSGGVPWRCPKDELTAESDSKAGPSPASKTCPTIFSTPYLLLASSPTPSISKIHP